MSVLRAWLIAAVVSGLSIVTSLPLALLPQPAVAQAVETIVI